MLDPRAPTDEFLRRLPLPLAQLYRRAVNAKSQRDAHDFAFYLWEAAIKLLACAEIAGYRAGNTPEPTLDDRLKNLARPSLGHWWEFVRLLTPKLAQRQDEYRALNEALCGRARSDLPRCIVLEATLSATMGQPAGSRSALQVGELFERLIEYRNKSIGHGAPAAKTPGQLRTVADALLLAAGELFDRLDLLGGRRLVVVTEVRLIRGVWLIERSELHGVVPWRIASLEWPRTEGDAPPATEGVHLVDPAHADEPRGLLALEPLIAYDAESETALILNRQRRGRRVEMLCYTTGRTLEQTVASESFVGVTEDGDEPPAAVNSSPSSTRRIGDYDIIGELGRGAMGVVYRAWQASLSREVALKVQPRAGDAKADARFRREIRALGRVDHPHLVKVYTSGSDGDQFYYTMELVEGAALAAVSDALTLADDGSTTIDLPVWKHALDEAYAAAKRGVQARHELTMSSTVSEGIPMPAPMKAAAPRPAQSRSADRTYIRHIVGLARQIADAVHALHEKGIIHRDIKPGNVLVSADGGNAVLMDLGLAQLADDIEGRLTRTRQFVGTLRYASPQQVLAAGQLDRRSDVYSLGATIWELLALRPIFGATDQTPTPELMELIQRTDPERLGRINPEVGRDLEAIVHKCLEKSPDARYATADELAADLGRWLDGEPVRARPVHGWERAAKWVRRRPLLTGLALALLLALFGAVIGTSWGLVKADRARDAEASARRDAEKQRDDAREQRRRTRAALDDMLGDESLAFITTQRELLPQQRAFLEKALKYYIDFAADAATDSAGRASVAWAQFRVGRIYQKLGKLPDAEAALRTALASYDALARNEGGVAVLRRGQAGTHISLGNVLQDQNKAPEGETEFRGAIGLLEQLTRDYPDVAEYRQLLGHSLNNLANLLQPLGRLDDAEQAHEAARDVRKSLATAFPAVVSYQVDLSLSHNNLANLYHRSHRYDKSLSEHAAALAIRTRLVTEYPKVPEHQRDLAQSHLNRANALAAIFRHEEAVAAFRAALALSRKLTADFPAIPEYRRDVARTLTNMSWSLDNLNRGAEAIDDLRSAIAGLERLSADYPMTPSYRNDLGLAFLNLGAIYRKTQQFENAERALQSALGLREKLVADFPKFVVYKIDVGYCQFELGQLAVDQNKAEAALELFSRAIATTAPIAEANPRQARAVGNLCDAYWNRAMVLSRTGRHADAVADWDRALALDDGVRPRLRPRRAIALARAGQTATAVAEADALARDPKVTADALYCCARLFSVVAATSSESTHAADRAILLLHQALSQGYREFNEMLQENDLAAIRARPDFADLLWQYADATAK